MEGSHTHRPRFAAGREVVVDTMSVQQDFFDVGSMNFFEDETASIEKLTAETHFTTSLAVGTLYTHANGGIEDCLLAFSFRS